MTRVRSFAAVPQGRSTAGVGNTPRGGSGPLPALAVFDQLVSDFGYVTTGDDVTMTAKHLIDSVGGYQRPEAPGAAWGYSDPGFGLFGNLVKVAYGASVAAGNAAMDASTVINDAFQADVAPVLQFQDGIAFSGRQGRGIIASPRDMCRLGLLWLRRGIWGSTRLLPDAFFDEFTKPQVSGSLPTTSGAADSSNYLGITNIGSAGTNANPYGPGIFGFAIWTNTPIAETGVRPWPDCPIDTYLTDGSWGVRVLVVMPTHNIVAAGSANWSTSPDTPDPKLMAARLKLLSDSVTGAGVLSPVVPGTTWNVVTDADAGMNTTTLNSFMSAVGGRVVVTRHGHLVRTQGTNGTEDWASSCKAPLAMMLALSAGS